MTGQSSDKEDNNANNTAIVKETTTVEIPTVETEEETIERPSIEDFMNIEYDYTYKDLIRYPNENVGKKIIITAQIQQVMDGGIFDSDSTYYRVTTKGDANSNYYLGDEYYIVDDRADTLKLLEDDVINIYGVVIPPEKITRAITWAKDEVPAIDMFYAEIISE